MLASTVVVDDAVLDDQLFFCEWMEVAFRSKVCASKGRGVAQRTRDSIQVEVVRCSVALLLLCW